MRPVAESARRTSFELYVFRRGKWLVESVFEDRGFAVEEAKSILERARGLAAVRVVAVEERGDEFRERVVFYGSSGLGGTPKPARAAARAAAAAPPGLLARHSHLALPVALLLIGCAIILVNHLNSRRHPWAFDQPDARLPHEVSMPWK